MRRLRSLRSDLNASDLPVKSLNRAWGRSPRDRMHTLQKRGGRRESLIAGVLKVASSSVSCLVRTQKKKKRGRGSAKMRQEKKRTRRFVRGSNFTEVSTDLEKVVRGMKVNAH